MPRFTQSPGGAVWTLVLFSLLNPATAQAIDVSFVKRDGTAVNWGTNIIYFGNPPKVGANFKVELGANGMVMAAGLYKIRLVGGKISSPDQQVRINGSSITIDASLIDESLRCASGIAWSQGQLYVAEYHSNDCLDKYVYKVGPGGALGDRIETVLHPIELAVRKDIAYVLGSQELAAFDLSTKQRIWSTKLDAFGGGVEHMALLGDRLCVSCPERNEIAQVDLTQGKPVGTLALPAALAKPPAKTRRATLPIAATPSGTLLVGTADALIEFSPEGKQLRTVAAVKDALALAVGPLGEIAVAMAAPNRAFYVLKLDPTGKPLLKIMKTAWNDVGNENCDNRYFAGLLGKVSWVGGMTFDDGGNLYVADRNDTPTNESPSLGLAAAQFRGLGNDMGKDGGIVKLSPAGDILARLASRFTDHSIIQSRLADHERRDPMLRTRALFTHGGRATIVVYGDSITQVGGDWNGGASDTQHNWAMLLPSLITARHPTAKPQVSARGIGGNVVYNGLCRVPQPEQADMDAALYLLEFGTNDVNRPSMPPERYAQGLRDFVQTLLIYSDADVALVTTGPLPGPELRDPADYHKAVTTVAAEYKLPVVDMTAAVNRALAGRDFTTLHLGNEPNRKKTDPHPNTAGHQVWAEATVETLENAVGQVLPKRRPKSKRRSRGGKGIADRTVGQDGSCDPPPAPQLNRGRIPTVGGYADGLKLESHQAFRT